MMLAAQIFCTAGAQGYPSNVNGAPPWFTLIRGKNLFQTDPGKEPVSDFSVWYDRGGSN